MFFTRRITRNLIKNRYPKTRRAKHTNFRLEVWDSYLLQWILFSDIEHTFPNPTYAYNTLSNLTPSLETTGVEVSENFDIDPLDLNKQFVSSVETIRDTQIYDSVSSYDTGVDSSSSSSSGSCGGFD